VKEKDAFPVPVWVVPGNHENFGIERDQSGVSEDHPLYGKAMYRRYLGPTYYSFDYGGVHFVALDTVDIEDRWYYAHVDATQLSWLEEDLSTVPAETAVVTFSHIPLFSAVIHGWNYYPDGGSLIEIDGSEQYRHMVSNYADVLERFDGRNYPLALGGHGHAREEIRLGDRRFATRFHQTSAVVGDSGEREGMDYVSGVTLYNINRGRINGWEFIPLDPVSGSVDTSR
jgi:3',5'-cyclic AMP phosphodiesterase CpdA